jgi:hypothetical protein
MIAKQILYFGHKLILVCDARCDKAWGINHRPRVQLSTSDEDDYAFLADGEVGEAPADPGTAEGDHRKPRTPGERLNKWCCRECERSLKVKPGEDFELPDFTRRVYNLPRADANGEAD